jgi:hypothetical protein
MLLVWHSGRTVAADGVPPATSVLKTGFEAGRLAILMAAVTSGAAFLSQLDIPAWMKLRALRRRTRLCPVR